MGMCAQFKELTPWAAGFLRREPWLVEMFVCWRRFDNSIQPVFRFLSPAQRASIDATLAALRPGSTGDFVLEGLERLRPADVERIREDLPRLEAEWDRPYLDLDKAWRGIVTEGVEDAASRAILGGEPLGADIAYGPARLMSPEDVATRANELVTLLAHWPAERVHLQVELDALVAYYAEAAREGRAMLAWLT